MSAASSPDRLVLGSVELLDRAELAYRRLSDRAVVVVKDRHGQLPRRPRLGDLPPPCYPRVIDLSAARAQGQAA